MSSLNAIIFAFFHDSISPPYLGEKYFATRFLYCSPLISLLFITPPSSRKTAEIVLTI
ncbi:MAG: hypothetical protein ACW981_21200 [Candidatus Hodarchaeales archaeon]|jgi:hypothetical protein